MTTRTVARATLLAVLCSSLAAACAQPAPPPTPTTLPPGVIRITGNYGTGGNDTSFILYKNDVTPAERLVVFVHGGSWTGGSMDLFPAPLREMVNHGYAVASINYPLWSVTRHREQSRHVKDALSWFKSQEAALGIEADDPVLAGFSAGGHLSALAATTYGEPLYSPHDGASEVRPGAVVMMAAPFDLADMVYSSNFLIALMGAEALTNYLNGSCTVVPNSSSCSGPLTEASPSDHMSPDDPPFYTVYSWRDEGISLSQESSIHDLAAANGIPSHQQATNITQPVAECTEYGYVAGCDDSPWYHTAVTKALKTSELVDWLGSIGLPA